MGADPLSAPPPPPGFRLDGVASPAPRKRRKDELPQPPEGFSLDEPAPSPSLGNDSIVAPRDGDTLRLQSGRNLRLYGVDAPELKQQGWNRQGQPVPIGRQSLQALTDTVAKAAASIGTPVGQSYGRPVAPVTVGGNDLGLTLARQGDAMAAPRYLGNDPARRHDYMQAERLARLNGLGIHDTMFQPPEQYRKAPMAAPSREAVAQFWDTPTPLAGMRAEAEKQYLALVNDVSVPAKQVQDFARANGFSVADGEVERVRKEAKRTGMRVGVNYLEAPKPLTDLGDGAAGAAVRGFGSGALAGGLDEVGALADTLGLTPGRENVWNSERRIADVWSNNQQQNSAILGFDDTSHPYATLGGEVAGGLVVPFGARARTVPELFRVGAAYGGAQGFLGTDGTLGERAMGAAVGVPVGGAIGAVGGKALEGAVRAAPRLGQFVRARFGSRVPESPPGGIDGVPAPSLGDITDGSIPAPPVGPANDRTAYSQHSDGQLENIVNRIAADRAEGDPNFARTYSDLLFDDIRTRGGNEVTGRYLGGRGLGMDADPATLISAAPRRPDVIDVSRPQSMGQPISDAQRRAMGETVDPRDVLPIMSNEVASAEEAAAIDAGRYAPLKPVNERDTLSRYTVPGQNGRDVAKVGPTDLIGWVRQNGGINDAGDGITKGGDLKAMGFTNARRKGMDFVGQEERFGPLVNDNGMTLDDAARRAWEAGYFPDHADRPSINDFLDALRGTHDGYNRRFRVDDLAEVDRFKATRAERMDLERQLWDGPVYVDRSAPADEPQPFAPPQAYEEWPAGGPDFAGNIDLRKLQSPQDIARALDFTDKRVGFDAATRGRVANAETERLASALGMTPGGLVSRRKGQAFNAEEALAARQLLAKSGNELVNSALRIRRLDEPGDELLADFREKWVRHVAIQEQVAGMTAEAGRALQQFRMLADSRAIKGDVLAAMVRGGGGKDNLKDAAEILIDAIEEGPGVFNAMAEKMAKPRFSDKLVELYVNSLLSGPQTHAVNMASNTLTALAQIPEHAIAAGIGKARAMLPGASVDRVIGSEVGARAFGLLQGVREGARLFMRSLKTGEPSDLVSKVEGQDMKAISGIKGEVARIPTRLLTAEDEFFKGIARRMELNGLAVRQARKEGLRGEAASSRIAELVANPPDDMFAASMDYARYLTFQQKLGPLASKVSGITQDAPALKLFLPFVRTPTNLLKFAVERSPAAPALKEWRADVLAGGARRDLAAAKALVGTGFGMAFYEAALQGKITGSPPTDPAKARLMYADGWQPYSIRIGDKWISYKRLDPFSTTLGTAADLALLPEGMSERQRDDAATLLVASIMGNLASKTWLSGVSDLVSALHEPDRNAGNLMQRLAGSIAVPAGVAQVARVVDPVGREADTMGDAVKARIPYVSRSLPAKRDVWGKPVRNEGGLGPDMLSPLWVTTAKDDVVNRQLLASGASIGKVPAKIAGQQLTPAQHSRYQVEAGQRSYTALRGLVTSPKWKTLDAESRQAEVAKVTRKARESARAVLFGPGRLGEVPNTPLKKVVPPPPRGFTMEGDAGGRNVFSDLKRAIPGVRFTSGFRTPEYQADMRRRGYKPASNSGHLDGSAFDMLPPAGKTLAWLRERVRRFDPNARLLVHDGHLHATFPGYYGAPALGGAKGTGLKNPNAGMPPPPAGFTLDGR